MKKYILIQNEGEIETNSFELIGASTKRDDATKIGFFGSGLKYSIAFMMRSNIDFKIFSGTKEMVFTTKPEALKDKTFERICINGVPTSYTTTMGPTWEHQWFVLREIYCNALDEESCQMVKSTEIVEATEGKTRIYIELTADLQEIINNWDAYFSDEREPLFVAEKIHTSYLYSGGISDQLVSVFKKTNGTLFRKGVRVSHTDKYLYDYECANVTINEDRTAKNPYAMTYAFASMAIMFVNENWIYSVLKSEDSSEYDALRTTTVNGEENEDAWMQFSKDYLLVVKEISGKYAQVITDSPKECLRVPESFALDLKKRIPAISILGMGKVIGDYSMEIIEPTQKMNFLIKEVSHSLEEMGYSIPYHIKVAEFKEDNVLGKADVDTKTIYIADKTFEKGRRELALTLMEETEHIRSNADDETREFQNHIFSKWLTYMEEKNALFL